MDTKKAKAAVKKNIKIAQKKGNDLKKGALKEYAKAKKGVAKAQVKGGELEKMAMKEYAKIKAQMDVTAKKVENYVKKNPKRVAAISAGIGAALGAVAGLLAASGKKGKKK